MCAGGQASDSGPLSLPPLDEAGSRGKAKETRLQKTVQERETLALYSVLTPITVVDHLCPIPAPIAKV